MEPNEKIQQTALQMFFRYGIKHVTMDDIAKELGMSKKTIYQYFKEKDDLVNQVCESEIKIHERDFNEFGKSAKDPIHEIILISDKMRDIMHHINPLFFLDLQKFYPVAFEAFQTFKSTCAFSNIVQNIDSGIKQGLYREDIDIEFAARYRLTQIDMLMFGNYFNTEKISFVEISEQLLEWFVYGICTLKGHKQLDHYKKLITTR